jgi:hypothetical protein
MCQWIRYGNVIEFIVKLEPVLCIALPDFFVVYVKKKLLSQTKIHLPYEPGYVTICIDNLTV